MNVFSSCNFADANITFKEVLEGTYYQNALCRNQTIKNLQFVIYFSNLDELEI